MSYHCNKCKQQRQQGCFSKGCPGMPRNDGDWRLPTLPAPDRTMWQHGRQLDHYTAEQMRAYALAAINGLADEADAEIGRLVGLGLGQ